MNRPTPRASRVTGSSPVIPEKGTERYVRALGRAFVTAFYGAMRSLRMYPVENPVVQKALGELSAIATEMLDDGGALELRIAGEFLFVNRTRLRLDLDNYATVNYLISQLRASGTGTLRVGGAATAADWMALLACLNEPGGDDAVARHHHLQQRLAAANVTAFESEPPLQAEAGSEGKTCATDPAKGAYAKSVAAAKDVMQSVRIGQSPNLKVVKRTVQLIVDRVMADEAAMLGLTTVRDYDDPALTHAVNVCIFSVALGRRLGLTRVQLYDLGLAALFHDCGQSRIAPELLEKPAPLSEDEWRAITGHPWMGVLTLFHLREHDEFPYHAIMVAYEHHLRQDGSGYPKRLRPRPVGLYSKIVGVIETFDAATSRVSRLGPPKSPSVFVAEMRRNSHTYMDPVVVLTFTDMLGAYPVGTGLVLDSGELAIAHSVNPNPDLASRPMALVISDAAGTIKHPGELVDLGETDATGAFKRTIVETIDPDRYGVRVGDYFL
jgi:HD-GYP domain-containing protein (c-di-GMP phosphodiesterase class II)